MKRAKGYANKAQIRVARTVAAFLGDAEFKRLWKKLGPVTLEKIIGRAELALVQGELEDKKWHTMESERKRKAYSRSIRFATQNEGL